MSTTINKKNLLKVIITFLIILFIILLIIISIHSQKTRDIEFKILKIFTYIMAGVFSIGIITVFLLNIIFGTTKIFKFITKKELEESEKPEKEEIKEENTKYNKFEIMDI